MAPNGTEIHVPPHSNNPCPAFNSCAEQATFLDFMHRRSIVQIVGCAFLDLPIFLHFALFVWACVDMHRLNRKRSKAVTARSIAEEIIAEMRARGELPPVREPLLTESSGALPVATAAEERTPSGTRYRGAEHGTPSPVQRVREV
ncbi:hypothetical protein LTR28_009546 [Elasticomyces elasticus]|nr:hypothetical protein LTR28_009546 [Elasticomyces elasticus]